MPDFWLYFTKEVKQIRDRYVTMREKLDCKFKMADLLTGQTYYPECELAEHGGKNAESYPMWHDDQVGLYIPVEHEGAVTFAYIGEGLLELLEDELSELGQLEEEDRYVNMHDLYDIPSQTRGGSGPRTYFREDERYYLRSKPEYFGLEEFVAKSDLLQQVQKDPPPVFPVYHIDALMANPYTYGLQVPSKKYPFHVAKNNNYGVEFGELAQEVYDIRLERSRQRDKAHYYGRMYKVRSRQWNQVTISKQGLLLSKAFVMLDFSSECEINGFS
ncbi:hypothetical protein CJU89_3734 [Yarrowia sp. B02]|nr:hypothetical protein CJU89_3734 [Yarrowia sp. B02]